jgi:hypothetical protein
MIDCQMVGLHRSAGCVVCGGSRLWDSVVVIAAGRQLLLVSPARGCVQPSQQEHHYCSA